MGRQAGSRRVHRVAASLLTRATDNPPDYTDAFEVPIPSTDTRTPEQWLRAVFEDAPREVALVPSAGVAGSTGPATRSTTVACSHSRLADCLKGARRGPSRTALGAHESSTGLAPITLDGGLEHTRVLHAAPGTPAVGGYRPDPSTDGSLSPRTRRVPPTVRDALKHLLKRKETEYQRFMKEPSSKEVKVP
jgi:hypothetical protein